MTAGLLALSVGANAASQAVRFSLCLLAGIASGAVALLYFRKARPLERALTDFFATVVIGGIFIICIEFFLNGKPELYGAAAFLAGTALVPTVFLKIRAAYRKRHKKDAAEPLPEERSSENDGGARVPKAEKPAEESGAEADASDIQKRENTGEKNFSASKPYKRGDKSSGKRFHFKNGKPVKEKAARTPKTDKPAAPKTKKRKLIR